MKNLGEFFTVLVVCSGIGSYFGYTGDMVGGAIISVLAMLVICLYNEVYDLGKKLLELEDKIKNQDKDFDIKMV